MLAGTEPPHLKCHGSARRMRHQMRVSAVFLRLDATRGVSIRLVTGRAIYCCANAFSRIGCCSSILGFLSLSGSARCRGPSIPFSGLSIHYDKGKKEKEDKTKKIVEQDAPCIRTCLSRDTDSDTATYMLACPWRQANRFRPGSTRTKPCKGV